MSAMIPCSRSARRRAGADRRDGHAGERARVAPAARSRSNRSRDAVGAGQADQVVGARGRGRARRAARSGSPAPRRPPRRAPRSRAASPLACARARVTATVSPASGRALEPREPLAERRDRPDHRDRRRPDLARSRAAAIVASVPVTTRWSGACRARSPRRAQRGRAPGGDQALGDRRRAAARPCTRRASRGTRRARPSRAPDSGLPGSSWPVTNATALASPRCVTGMPAYAGAATPAVTPGTTSNGIPAARQRLGLLAAAAEHERVAALQSDDRLPRVAPRSTSSRSISSWDADSPPPSLPA